MYWEQESNLHFPYGKVDFKSTASTYSAIPAFKEGLLKVELRTHISNATFYLLNCQNILCDWRDSNPYVFKTLDPKSSLATNYNTIATFNYIFCNPPCQRTQIQINVLLIDCIYNIQISYIEIQWKIVKIC